MRAFAVLLYSYLLLVSMQLELLARTLVARPVEFPATRKFQSQSTMTAYTQTGIYCEHLGWQGAGYKKEDWADHRFFSQMLAIGLLDSLEQIRISYLPGCLHILPF